MTHLGSWILAASTMAWLPEWTRFNVSGGERADVELLLFDPNMAKTVRRPIGVLAPAPLLAALVERACRAPLRRDVPEDRRLAGVLLDEVRAARELPLLVRSTTRTRLEGFHESGLKVSASIDAMAATLGRSRRTMERAFVREVGLSAGQWRQQARWARAIALLGEGRSVKDVAHDVGYRSASAFVAAFRRAMGTTPKRMVRGRD